MAGVPAAVDASVGGRRIRGGVLGWIVLALLVALLAFELIVLIGSNRNVPRASVADTDVARRFALGMNSSPSIVVGPRVQRISGGRATFLVVVDQTVTSEGSPAQPRLVHTGLLVTVLEKNHKVASVQVL